VSGEVGVRRAHARAASIVGAAQVITNRLTPDLVLYTK
jgi:hypothetical protein